MIYINKCARISLLFCFSDFVQGWIGFELLLVSMEWPYAAFFSDSVYSIIAFAQHDFRQFWRQLGIKQEPHSQHNGPFL